MNNEISIEQLKELYIDTIKKCSSEEMKNKDDIIEYNIFEEFDIGFISFLNLNNVKKLYENELITSEMFNKTKQLVEKVRFVQDNNLWCMKSIKNSDEWKNIIKISDEILELETLNMKSTKYYD